MKTIEKLTSPRVIEVLELAMLFEVNGCTSSIDCLRFATKQVYGSANSGPGWVAEVPSLKVRGTCEVKGS